ncbi:hypothetical protein [Streptococcus sp.]|uniref:hypothetical protein n=1 Tax=Streptococcus sp. TaxID=1306 RepID=UPI00391D9ACA
MKKLGDKGRLSLALLGAIFVLVSMYLVPFMKPENQFFELALFIIGLLLIIWSLLSLDKRNSFQHFFAGMGEIPLLSYILISCICFSPFVHIFIMGKAISSSVLILTILSVLLFALLTISRIYRKWFY